MYNFVTPVTNRSNFVRFNTHFACCREFGTLHLPREETVASYWPPTIVAFCYKQVYKFEYFFKGHYNRTQR